MVSTPYVKLGGVEPPRNPEPPKHATGHTTTELSSGTLPLPPVPDKAEKECLPQMTEREHNRLLAGVTPTPAPRSESRKGALTDDQSRRLMILKETCTAMGIDRSVEEIVTIARFIETGAEPDM